MMHREAIIRAWKDPTFRASLSPQERAQVPENPSGAPLSELDESELGNVQAAFRIRTFVVECFRTAYYWCPYTTDV